MNLSIQQAGQTTKSISLLLWMLQLLIIVVVTDDAGCPNLLCHRVKILEKIVQYWLEEEEIEGTEVLLKKEQNFLNVLIEEYLDWVSDGISYEDLFRS